MKGHSDRLPVRFRSLIAILALAAAYFLAGKFGLSLAIVHPSASTVWPPSGIAFAALLVWGYRLWPGVFLGAFLANIARPGLKIIVTTGYLEPELKTELFDVGVKDYIHKPYSVDAVLKTIEAVLSRT